jgi:hypothetical protein
MEEQLDIRFGSGEDRTVGTGGRFTFNDETSGLLLASLPPLIHICGELPHAHELRSARRHLSHHHRNRNEAARRGGDSGRAYAPSCL